MNTKTKKLLFVLSTLLFFFFSSCEESYKKQYSEKEINNILTKSKLLNSYTTHNSRVVELRDMDSSGMLLETANDILADVLNFMQDKKHEKLQIIVIKKEFINENFYKYEKDHITAAQKHFKTMASELSMLHRYVDRSVKFVQPDYAELVDLRNPEKMEQSQIVITKGHTEVQLLIVWYSGNEILYSTGLIKSSIGSEVNFIVEFDGKELIDRSPNSIIMNIDPKSFQREAMTPHNILLTELLHTLLKPEDFQDIVFYYNSFEQMELLNEAIIHSIFAIRTNSPDFIYVMNDPRYRMVPGIYEKYKNDNPIKILTDFFENPLRFYEENSK